MRDVMAKVANHRPLMVPPSAKLLYENSLASLQKQGRSEGPKGAGPHAHEADVLVPFHYRVVVAVDPAGHRAMRFPTRTEQPGGGQFYSWFAAYVACRGSLVRGRRAYAWRVHVPHTVDVSRRCSYLENRFVFALGIEDRENHIGVRFDGLGHLALTVGPNAQQAHEQVLARVALSRDVRAGETLQWVAAVDFVSQRRALSVTGDDGVLWQGEWPAADLSAANVAILSSSGNTFGSDTDPHAFFHLSQPQVFSLDDDTHQDRVERDPG